MDPFIGLILTFACLGAFCGAYKFGHHLGGQEEQKRNQQREMRLKLRGIGQQLND